MKCPVLSLKRKSPAISASQGFLSFFVWVVGGDSLEMNSVPLTQVTQEANYLVLGQVGLEKETPIRRLWVPAGITTESKTLQPLLNCNTSRKSTCAPDGETSLQITYPPHGQPFASSTELPQCYYKGKFRPCQGFRSAFLGWGWALRKSRFDLSLPPPACGGDGGSPVRADGNLP
jgi:hypothetical protein